MAFEIPGRYVGKLRPRLHDFGLSEADVGRIEHRRAAIRADADCAKLVAFVGCYLTVVGLCWPTFGWSGLLFVIPVLIVFGVGPWPLLSRWSARREERVEGADHLDSYRQALQAYEREEVQREKEARREAARAELEKKRRHHAYWSGLSPLAFEREVAALFKSCGYEAQLTSASGDQGVDIFVGRGGVSAAVQCKRYTAKVGPGPVRELIGAMRIHRVSRGVLVCPSGFTTGAFETARKANITLIGLKRIVSMAEGTWEPFPRSRAAS